MHEFYIEMACNGMFGTGIGLLMIGPPDPNKFFQLTVCDLAVPCRAAWTLLHDFQVILGMARDLPSDSPRAAQALVVANSIVNVYRMGEEATLEEGHAIAQRFLASRNGEAQHVVTAIGHCHLGKLGLP